jgi:pilus assembly protein CpaF
VVEGTNILVDRGSGLSSTGQRFTSADSVTRVARHLLSRARVQLDASRPIAEATLNDGTHILAILPPVAVGGALVEIRRVGRPGPSGESLVSAGMLSADMLRALRSAIAVRRNIVVVGPSDAGVAQLVGALAAMGGPEERLLVIEAMSELPIANPRAVRLAAAGTSFSELLVRASRLRADRVVIDGVRGGEAREALLLAASRGGGTIVGIRTASSNAVLQHLESLASLAGGRDGVGALVTSSVHVVVRLVRGADGARRVESIAEAITGSLTELFEHGEGGFASTGAAPSFA